MLISPKSRELHKISDSKVSYGITETSLDLCSGNSADLLSKLSPSVSPYTEQVHSVKLCRRM